MMRNKAVPILFLILAACAVPASATIQFSYCDFGCSNTNAGMTYTAFQAVTSGLTFPLSPITFSAVNLDVSGIYTDPATGTIFTGFNGSTQEALTVSGTSLAETGSNGQNRPIQIDLPANTYAIAMLVSSVSGSAFPNVGLTATPASFNGGAFDYQINISGSGSSVFFGLISDTPIARLFIGDTGFSQSPIRILSFETGQNLPVSQTPETSTLAMIGGGLLAVGLFRRRALALAGSR